MRRFPGIFASALLGACASSGTDVASKNTLAAPATPTLSAIAPACQAEAYRQFDFWIGSWNVMVAGGKQAGDNTIEVINDGCALMESYETAGGYRGRSVNMYDAGRQVWHQTWVDNSGLLLGIEGGMIDGSMVMTGTGQRATPQGDVLDRISWTPQADGSVRQVWEISADQGASWKTIFDGRYQRKP